MNADGSNSETAQHVLVIGAATIDAKGRAQGALEPGSSVPGEITSGIGGVARNVAENLAQWAALLRKTGDDAEADEMEARAKAIREKSAKD